MKKAFGLLLSVMIVIGANLSLAQDSGRTPISVDNASQLQELMRLGRGSAEAVAWTPDGSTILVGGTLGVWKYDATALDTMLEPELLNPGGEVDHFAISPDGSVIAISHSDSSGVEFRDYATGDIISTYEGETSRDRLMFNSDGSYLSINGGSNGLEIVDIASGTLYNSAEASLDTGVPVLYNADTTQIAAATRNYTVITWDFVNGGDPLEMSGHTSTINDIAYSPDGSLIASASSDDSVRIFNAADGTEVAVITQAADDDQIRDAYAVTFTPDGTGLITGHSSGKLRFWDVASATQTNSIELGGSDSIEDIVFSPDGSQFVVLTQDAANAVQLFMADGTLVSSSVGHNEYVYAVEFSPDSGTLVFSDSDRYLYLWDTATVEEITFGTKVEDGATSGIDNKSNLTYSSDGQYLATLQSFSAMLRDPITGATISEFEVDGIAEDIEFSPDNTMLAFVTSQGFYVFDVPNATLLYSNFDGHDWLQDVTWSADQTMIATVSGDHAVRVYSIGG